MVNCVQLQVLAGGLNPQISPSPEGHGPPSNTMCHWTLQVYQPNGTQIRQTVKQNARVIQMTDRPRYGEMDSYRRNLVLKRFHLKGEKPCAELYSVSISSCVC